MSAGKVAGSGRPEGLRLHLGLYHVLTLDSSTHFGVLFGHRPFDDHHYSTGSLLTAVTW